MKNILLISAFILLGTSCQKVINVDLNAANPQYVIEANLYEGTHTFTVRVTQTTSYFQGGSNIPTVDNASITISDGINPPQTLLATGNGTYELMNYTAFNQLTYQLKVNVDGKTFEASSYLPVSPVMDSLTYEIYVSQFGGGGKEDRYLSTAHFQDSVGVANYYRLLVTKNGKFENGPFDLFMFDDQVRDGRYFDLPVFTAFAEKDDHLDVEILSMDAHVYDYFVTLGDILTGDANNSAAPANPNSNFTNGALGYFGAFSSMKQSVRIE